MRSSSQPRQVAGRDRGWRAHPTGAGLAVGCGPPGRRRRIVRATERAGCGGSVCDPVSRYLGGTLWGQRSAPCRYMSSASPAISATIAAAGCMRVTSPTPCPAYRASASTSPCIPATRAWPRRRPSQGTLRTRKVSGTPSTSGWRQLMLITGCHICQCRDERCVGPQIIEHKLVVRVPSRVIRGTVVP